LKDEKGGEEAGETGKPEPVGGIEEAEEDFTKDQEVEVGPPEWLRWMLMVMSHLLLAAIAFVVTWIFFPREYFYFVDVNRGTMSRAPAGTHLDAQGALVIPGINDGQAPPARSDSYAVPPTPQPGAIEQARPQTKQRGAQSVPQAPQTSPAPPARGGKDKNAPRQ
jgi:hypothetical protein